MYNLEGNNFEFEWIREKLFSFKLQSIKVFFSVFFWNCFSKEIYEDC